MLFRAFDLASQCDDPSAAVIHMTVHSKLLFKQELVVLLAANAA